MNRREVVKLGVVGIAASCVGCGGGGDPEPDAPSAPGFEMCGPNVCVNLADPANAALASTNGSRAFNFPAKVIVVRRSDTEFAVVSRVCTHNECSVAYLSSTGAFRCPCHGSTFTIDGQVTNGPATRSLKRYANTFDAATQILTITLT